MMADSGEPPAKVEVAPLNVDLRRLTKALVFAAEAHRNQRRKGAAQEPYLNHLIEVLDLVVQVTDGVDMDVVIAALLHDVVEDTAANSRRCRYELRGACRRNRSGELRRHVLA